MFRAFFVTGSCRRGCYACIQRGLSAPTSQRREFREACINLTFHSLRLQATHTTTTSYATSCNNYSPMINSAWLCSCRRRGTPFRDAFLRRGARLDASARRLEHQSDRSDETSRSSRRRRAVECQTRVVCESHSAFEREKTSHIGPSRRHWMLRGWNASGRLARRRPGGV